MTPTAMAVVLAVALFGLGLATGIRQVLGLRQLAARRHVPSDEFAYLRNRYRRRLLTAGLLLAVGSLIAGAYLSGMEGRADALGEHRPVAENEPPTPETPAAKREMTEPDRQFVRFWGAYWIVVIVLLFTLVGLAMIDAIAARRYWLGVYRQMKEEHQVKLRRDLAVHRQQRDQAREKLLRRNRGSDSTGEPPAEDS